LLQPFRNEVEQIILATGDPKKALSRVLRVISRDFELSAALLGSWNENLRKLEWVAQQGVVRGMPKLIQQAEARILELPALPPLTAAKDLETFLMSAPASAHPSARSPMLLYPLLRGDKPAGAVLLRKRSGSYQPGTLEALHAIAALLLLLIENKHFVDRMHLLANAANLDGLTELFNHRFFQEILANELLRAQRMGFPVSLLLLDIDHFKKYNDTYGHPKGDVALGAISAILKRDTRSYDTPARYGGEELSVVLPHTSHRQAVAVAERIRRDVAKYPFPGLTPHGRASLTVSIGVASYPNNAKTKADLIDRADQALYLAKAEGRNRVCSSLMVSRKVIRFAFCPPAFTSSYYRDILAGVRDVITEFGNIDLLVFAPESESDNEGFTRICRTLVKEKVDAVGLCTKSTVFAKQILRFNKARIPVFQFNRAQRVTAGRVAAYIGYNQRKAGQEIARYLARIMRHQGNILLLRGLAEAGTALRVRGFAEIIRDYPGMAIVADVEADWLRKKARLETLTILRRKGVRIDAVVALNDEMALGAAEAVVEVGKRGEIFVVGLDGTQDALAAIRTGKLTATLNTNPREIGRVLVRSVVRGLIKHETLRKEIESPINIVDLENVGQY
jgi:diguanylate cyclase (GGDEF)-like protein